MKIRWGLLRRPRRSSIVFRPPGLPSTPAAIRTYLRGRLAEKFDLHPDQFLVGNGANEVITFVIKAFCQEGDNIITADRTFAVYEWVAEFSGVRGPAGPAQGFWFR